MVCTRDDDSMRLSKTMSVVDDAFGMYGNDVLERVEEKGMLRV